MNRTVSSALAAALLAATPVAAQTGEDRYVGYYYPAPTSTEVFESKLAMLQGMDRPQRVQFTTIMAQGTLQGPYRFPYAVFVKGGPADRMIVVGLQPGELSTLYRMRAVLANMTSQARLSTFFQERTIAEDSTFFDLLKMLGFRTLTITDGDKLTHQVTIK
jgi:hypothetical protein